MGIVKKAMLEELWEEQKEEDEEREKTEAREALEEERLIEESIQDQLESNCFETR